jgi:hypothetical protein
MGLDCGFDIYPPLEPTAVNQQRYDDFLCRVIEAYKPDTGPRVAEIIRVDEDSRSSYIEFLVGEHPRLPRRCHHLLRFSSTVTGSSAVDPHVRRVHDIARHVLGDRVYFWGGMVDSRAHIARNGCYSWNEIQLAQRKFDELAVNAGEQEPQEEQPSSHESDEAMGAVTVQLAKTAKLYDIRPVPTKGQGCIAVSKIAKGIRILQEAPLFLMPYSVKDKAMAERFVIEAVKRLTQEQQRSFLSLQNSKKGQCSPFLGIAETNGIPIHEDAGGLFLEASRINHSCRPNTEHLWNTDLKCLTIHAMEDIEIGSEITISYMSGDSLVYQARQRYLAEEFSFTCTCQLCSCPPSLRATSDKRLQEIQSIHSLMANKHPGMERPVASFGLARQLIRLLKEEGIRDTRLCGALYYAFQIAIAVGDKARAKLLAHRAYESRKLLTGDDSPKTAVFKRLAERPVEDPVFGQSYTGYCAHTWEPPGEMSEKQLEAWLWDVSEWNDRS